MTTFGKATEDDDRRPLRVVVLPPSAFVEKAAKRPTEPFEVGLRLISEGDILALRVKAARGAKKAFPDFGPDNPVWDEHYSQVLMLGAIARALCSAEDRTQPRWEAQETVVTLLTKPAVERLWDELEALQVTAAPSSPEASPADLARLRELLATPRPFGHLLPGDARGARRLLRRIVDLLSTT